MDTTASLLTAIYNLLKDDGDLHGIVADRIYPMATAPDTINPYIVNQLSFNEADTPMDTGLLIVHIWDKSPTASRVLEIKGRVYCLLNKKNIRTDEIGNCRVWYFSDGFIPDEPGYWHYIIQFNLRLVKTTELNAVIERDTS